MPDSKCQTVFLAVHNTIWGWWYKTMANFHWIRSYPMDSQCKCHSGGTNIFRFYDKHKCIINLDLVRNTELVPNIQMSYTEKRWKNSNACQYLSTNNLNKLPIYVFVYYPFMRNFYWGLLTNAYRQDILFYIWLWEFIISTNLSDISLMPAMWIFLDFWQRQFVPLALISIFICSENRKGKKSNSGASFKLEKCKYKIQAPQIRKKGKQEIRKWK